MRKGRISEIHFMLLWSLRSLAIWQRNDVTNKWDFLPLQAVVCHPPPPYECKKRMIYWNVWLQRIHKQTNQSWYLGKFQWVHFEDLWKLYCRDQNHHDNIDNEQNGHAHSNWHLIVEPSRFWIQLQNDCMIIVSNKERLSKILWQKSVMTTHECLAW